MSSKPVFETPSQLLRGFEHSAKKRFGQHFLVDPNILGGIASSADVAEGDHVLEIGPGCGTLTLTMLQRGAIVQACEVDRDAIAFLRYALEPNWPLTIVAGDVLRQNLDELLTGFGDSAEGAPVRWKVVANLPYNVATEIFFRLIEVREHIDVMSLMFQKEVAKRLIAKVGDNNYGALSLMCHLYCDAELVMSLPPGAFVPPPKVNSAVVRFRPLPQTRIADVALREEFVRIVKGAFGMRRKTMANALFSVGIEKDATVAALEGIGRKANVRAEVLGFDEFLAVTAVLNQR